MKRLMIMLALCLTTLSLSACAGSWTNPNIVDPATSDRQYYRDNTYCEEWADKQVYAGDDREADARDRVLGAETFDDSMGQYRSYEDNQSAYEHCMKARGWRKK